MSAMDLSERVLLELAELRAEVRALRADLRRRDADPALLAALEEEFGPGRFTAAGLLKLADEDPHGAIGEAIAAMIDMNAAPKSRTIQLAARLKRMAEIKIVAKSHGTLVYRVGVDSTGEPT